MSLSCQAKILRAIQEKKVVPVGSEEEVDCDVRIIAATNQNLHYLVDQGKFREDLFYRLCGLEIHLPPLRERVEDIELLSIHFLKKISVTGYQSFSREALDRLKSFSWPGNVRQLQQAVLAAATVCEESIILPEHLPPWVCKTQDPRSSKDFHNSLPAPEMDQQRRMLGIEEQKERQRYLEALHKTRYSGTGRWNISAAARDLGVARKTLAYRIKKLGIPYS